MDESDEIVRGGRKRGRPMRPMAMGDTRERGEGTFRHRDCPKYRRSWCSVTARCVSPDGPACKYGKVLIIAARRNEKGKARK